MPSGGAQKTTDEIAVALGRFCGFGETPGNWSSDQTALLLRFINGGYRWCLNGPPVDVVQSARGRAHTATLSRGNTSHPWKFLKPVRQVAISAEVEYTDATDKLTQDGFTEPYVTLGMTAIDVFTAAMIGRHIEVDGHELVIGRLVYASESDVGTLTTRTDDDTGVATLGAGHGVLTISTVDVTWDGGSRTGMEVTDVTGTAVSINGGAGDVLPAQTTAVTLGYVSHRYADGVKCYAHTDPDVTADSTWKLLAHRWPLPKDCIGVEGDITHVPSADQKRPAIGIGNEQGVRQLEAEGLAQTGRPQKAAVRQWDHYAGQQEAQRMELMIYPSPDQAYTLLIRQIMSPPDLEFDNEGHTANIYPIGGPLFSQLVELAAVAYADWDLNKQHAEPWDAYMRMLPSVIASDARGTVAERFSRSIVDRSDYHGIGESSRHPDDGFIVSVGGMDPD